MFAYYSYLPLDPFVSPCTLSYQSKEEQIKGSTALMMAAKIASTATVEAIVAADPAPDHIRMTTVRSSGIIWVGGFIVCGEGGVR